MDKLRNILGEMDFAQQLCPNAALPLKIVVYVLEGAVLLGITALAAYILWRLLCLVAAIAVLVLIVGGADDDDWFDWFFFRHF